MASATASMNLHLQAEENLTLGVAALDSSIAGLGVCVMSHPQANDNGALGVAKYSPILKTASPGYDAAKRRYSLPVIRSSGIGSSGLRDYLAYSMQRNSRTRVTLTSPGYSISSSTLLAMSRAIFIDSRSSTDSASTITRTSRPA